MLRVWVRLTCWRVGSVAVTWGERLVTAHPVRERPSRLSHAARADWSGSAPAPCGSPLSKESQMATTSPIQNASNGHAPSVRVELRTIALSRIVVPDGFNPRGEVVDDSELEAMAETMRQRGCLQPIRVRATETGEYALVAGERRYRAAAKATLVELPAVVIPVGTGDEAEYLDLLCDA